jgi:hypothetical protein
MQDPATRGAQTWAAAATGSLGLHAAAAWLLGAIDLGAPTPVRITPRLDVFLVPREPSIEAAPLRPEPETEADPESESESEANLSPAVANDEPTDELDGEPGAAPPASAAGSTSPRVRIDWNTEIARAVERLRSATPSYRSFGYPEVPDDGSSNRSARAASPVTPGEVETTAWGEQRTMLNDSCYQGQYEPGSVLAEQRRFMNPFVICAPSAPAEPRDDLFEDIEPGYLR